MRTAQLEERKFTLTQYRKDHFPEIKYVNKTSIYVNKTIAKVKKSLLYYIYYLK